MTAPLIIAAALLAWVLFAGPDSLLARLRRRSSAATAFRPGSGNGSRRAGHAERNGIQPTSSRSPRASGREAAQERHARSTLAPRSTSVSALGVARVERGEQVPQRIRDYYRQEAS